MQLLDDIHGSSVLDIDPKGGILPRGGVGRLASLLVYPHALERCYSCAWLLQAQTLIRAGVTSAWVGRLKGSTFFYHVSERLMAGCQETRSWVSRNDGTEGQSAQAQVEASNEATRNVEWNGKPMLRNRNVENGAEINNISALPSGPQQEQQAGTKVCAVGTDSYIATQSVVALISFSRHV